MIQHVGVAGYEASKQFPAGLPAAMVPGKGRWPCRPCRRGSSGRGRGDVGLRSRVGWKRLVELGVFMFKVMVDGRWYVDINITYIY